MRDMFDGITPSAVPAGAQLYAGYLNGHWPSYAALCAAHPAAVHVSISVTASYNGGQVLDIETGDATPAQSVDWVINRRAAGVDPTAYCNTSTWPAVRAAFQARKVAEPHYWLAQYDNVASFPTAWARVGVVAKQYADRGGYDISVVADYWPGIDPAPTTRLSEEILMSGFIASITPSAGQNPGVWLWLDGQYAGLATQADATGIATALDLKTITLSVGTHQNLLAATRPVAGAGASAAQVASAVLAAQGSADTAAAQAAG